MSAPDRRKKLDRAHPVLSIRRQCVLLSVARSGVYRPTPPDLLPFSWTGFCWKIPV